MTKYNYFKFNVETDNNVQNFKKTIVFNDEQKDMYKNALSLFDLDRNGRLDAREIKNFWDTIKYYAAQNEKGNILDSSEYERMYSDLNPSSYITFSQGMNMKPFFLKSVYHLNKVPLVLDELLSFANTIANTVNKGTGVTNSQYDEEMHEKLVEAEKEKHLANVTKEITSENRNPNLSQNKIEDWNDAIVREALKYNISPEILTVIIGRECHYVDSDAHSKHGCMQVCDIDNIKSDRYNLFKTLDKKAYYDLMENLKTKGLDDISTGIKAGILAFKSSYGSALANYMGYRKYGQPDILRAMKEYREGKIHLAPQEAKTVMHNALVIYNSAKGIKENYAKDCVTRLDGMNFDYNNISMS